MATITPVPPRGEMMQPNYRRKIDLILIVGLAVLGASLEAQSWGIAWWLGAIGGIIFGIVCAAGYSRVVKY